MTGLYWHFVDIVWIFLFPLLYLLGAHATLTRSMAPSMSEHVSLEHLLRDLRRPDGPHGRRPWRRRQVDLGALNDVVALAIAVTKALLVMLFFMHVRYSTAPDRPDRRRRLLLAGDPDRDHDLNYTSMGQIIPVPGK